MALIERIQKDLTQAMMSKDELRLSVLRMVKSALKYKEIEAWTGGVQGITIAKPEPPFGLPLNEDQWLYFFTLAVALVMFVLGWNLLRGRVGRALVADCESAYGPT